LHKNNENSPVAISKAIKAVNANFKDGGCKTRNKSFGKCFGTEDLKEGTTAFLEKKNFSWEIRTDYCLLKLKTTVFVNN
jgi:hypothetical protein